MTNQNEPDELEVTRQLEQIISKIKTYRRAYFGHPQDDELEYERYFLDNVKDELRAFTQGETK